MSDMEQPSHPAEGDSQHRPRRQYNRQPGSRPPGRPADSIQRCSACGEVGHLMRRGKCSPAYLAVRMMRETGCSIAAAAEAHDVDTTAVRERLRLERSRGEVVGGPQIEEHW